MNIQRIEYFIKVAEYLNFRKAARELHISHQALSKQIRFLEQELGAALLERNANKIKLTEVGKKVVDTFTPILREIRQETEEIGEFIRIKKNTLKLGYFNGLSYKRVVEPIVQQFDKDYPDICINILAADIGLIRELLMEDSIDVAVSLLNGKDEWFGVEYFSIYQEPMKIVVSNNHPWYQRDKVGMKEMMEEKMLVFENRPLFGMKSFLPDIVSAERIPVRNMDTYMGMLEQGKAFGIISDLNSRIKEGEFRLFSLPEEYKVDTKLIIAYKKQHPFANKIRTLKNIEWN
ncbi:MAG: LysR family transcriptional regulator [Eubacterium sp.]